MKKSIALLLTAPIALMFSLMPVSPLAAVDLNKANPCDRGYVFNVDGICELTTESQNPNTDSVYILVSDIMGYLLIAVGILAAIMIVISGIKIATSAGESEKVKNAKNTLLWSVIGLALALMARLIIEIVINFTNQL